MIRIFKMTIARREDGYTLDHSVMYFTDDQDPEQCDMHGNILSDPIFTFDHKEKTITELINPEELDISKHETYIVYTEITPLRATWINALASPQTIFTVVPINVFSDQFHRETLV